MYAYNDLHSLIMKWKPFKHWQQLVSKAKQETIPRWVLSAPFLTLSLDQLLWQQRWCYPARQCLEIQDQWGSLVICTLDARTHILQLRKYFQSWCRLVFKAHLSSTSLKPRQRLQLSSLELVDVLPQESLWHKPVWQVWSTVTSWFPSGKFRVLTSNMYLVSSTQLKNQESLARANINQALIFTSTCPLGACEEQGTCLTKLHPALGPSQRCLGMTLTPWSLHGCTGNLQS